MIAEILRRLKLIEQKIVRDKGSRGIGVLTSNTTKGVIQSTVNNSTTRGSSTPGAAVWG